MGHTAGTTERPTGDAVAKRVPCGRCMILEMNQRTADTYYRNITKINAQRRDLQYKCTITVTVWWAAHGPLSVFACVQMQLLITTVT